MSKEFLEKLREYDLEHPTMRHAATLVADATRLTVNNRVEKSEDELWEIYQKVHARSDSIKREDVYFFEAEISNASLDSHFTRMAKSSLQNYVADAIQNRGVMFQDSHARNQLGVGRSIWAQLVESGEAPPAMKAEDYFPAVYANFFVVRGKKLGNISTDDFIKGVDDGTIADVSIGFKEGEGFQYACSVCGLDMWDWDCPHVPGYEYEHIENPDDDPSVQRKSEQMCFAWVENARLSEVSAVYDGSTSNAMIVKATRELRAGRLNNEVKQNLETRYRFKFDESKRLYTGIDFVKEVAKEIFQGDEALTEQFQTRLRDFENNKKTPVTADEKERENTEMSETKDPQSGKTAVVDLTPRLRQLSTDLGLKFEEEATATDLVNGLRAEINRLRPIETEFNTFRTAEIADALAEKVRALGEKADKERTEKMLNTLDVTTIRELKNEWTAAGDKRFGKNRSSVEGDEKEGDERGEGDPKEEEETAGEKERGAKSKERHVPVTSYGAI